jgi:DNA-binding CsgD family transcriptional regulator/PAS domain-containing protein
MGSAPSIILQSRCPSSNDADVLQLLDLLATSAQAAWVDLDLRLEGGEAQRYRRGTIEGDFITLQLSTDGFEAVLRLGADGEPEPELVSLFAFSLDKILHCRRHDEQVTLLRGALDTTPSAVLLFDASGGIIYANPPADSLLARQTEDGLAVEGPTDVRQPLVSFLCARVEKVAAARWPQSSWTQTLTLSDGTALACEIMQMDAGGRVPSPGVLAVLQPVPALSKLCLDSFCVRHRLSPREQDVVRLLLEGRTTTAMADCLNISLHTVRDHLKRLYRKTEVRSRSELLSVLSTAGSSPASQPSGSRSKH